MNSIDNQKNFTTKINNVHQIPNDRQILILKEYPKNLDLYVQQIKSKEKIFEKGEIILSELEEKNSGLLMRILVIVKVLIEGKIYDAEIGFGFKCWDDMKEYPKIMGIRTNDCIEKGTNITFIT